MVTIGFALASAVFSWIGGNLVGTYGRPVVVWGLVGVLACVIGLAAAALFVPAEWVAWVMAGVMVIGGIGGGLVMSPNQTLTLADIPVKQGGIAGSIGQLGQRIGTSVGTAVALSLFYATIYREGDSTAPDIVVYHDAYAYGMTAVADLHRPRLPHLGRRPELAAAGEAHLGSAHAAALLACHDTPTATRNM